MSDGKLSTRRDVFKMVGGIGAMALYEPTSAQGYQVNATDKVITESGLTPSEVTMSTAKQADGALLAWKAITINA